MTTPTSSSDRYAEARAAEIEWGNAPHEPRNLRELKAKDAAAKRMWLALRALITPPATDETPEQIADAILIQRVGHVRGTAHFDSIHSMIAEGVNAGIQAAWETWEPENAPGLAPAPTFQPECAHCGEYIEPCSNPATGEPDWIHANGLWGCDDEDEHGMPLFAELRTDGLAE